MTTLNFDNLTFDEIEHIEAAAGMRMSEMFVADQMPSNKVLKIFAFLTLQRDNPAITMEDVGKMPYVQVMSVLGSTQQELPAPDPKADGNVSSEPNSSAV